MCSSPVTQLPHPPERDTIRNVNPLRQTQPRRREPDRPSIHIDASVYRFLLDLPNGSWCGVIHGSPVQVSPLISSSVSCIVFFRQILQSSSCRVHVQLLFPAEGVPDLGLLEKEYDVLEEEEGDNCVPLNLQKDSPSSSQDGEKDGVTDSGSQVPEATQDFSGIPDIDNIDSHRESAHLNRNTLQICGLKGTISVALLVVLVDAFHSHTKDFTEVLDFA
ncbi:hypothetical protein TRIUR3_03657 [Triticum urartu]|uniref:Uncharacterized protein n=1 Tax=Triticum urartu TaxID=4572 RepID=M7ZWW1_TRIUA|nr:hypothetical protein TRIUR3_03657 [Triticum urartu]